MKRILFILILLCIEKSLHAQQPYVYTIKADSVKITNTCDTAELIIENHTQTVPGFLFNKGRGRTEFRRAQKLNDSTLLLGGDSIVLRGNTTASNGLSMSGRDVQFGGKLIKDSTVLDLNSKALILNLGTGARNFLINSGNFGFGIQTPAGNQSGYPQMNFYMKDTANRQGVVGIRNDANIDTRCAFLSAGESYSYSQYPENGPGMFVAIWTGQYTQHATYFFRNGNVGINTTAYRLSDRLAVAGTGLFTDTLKLPNIISKSDTANYKPMAIDANGNIFKLNSWNVSASRKSATVTGSSYTVPADVDVVFVNYTGGTATITLPSGTLDREITIKNLNSTNSVALSGLDASESNTIATRGAITVKYTGSSWVGISKY